MQVRTAEVAAVLSLATDLAARAPFEHGLRGTIYAMRIVAELKLDDDETRRTYYLTALAGAGEASGDLAELMGVPTRAASRSIAARVARVARDLDAERTRLGPDAAHNLIRSRARLPLDRRIAAAAIALDPIGPSSVWDGMLAAEPRPHRMLAAGDIDAALAALGVFGALASPYFRGHSAAVSALAAAVAVDRGLPDDEVTLVRRAGLLHDLGRAGVAREVWERPGPLGPDDWAEIRAGVRAARGLLVRVPWLASIGRLASRTDPRPDVRGNEAALILAACDAYCAMLADRPHRPAMAPAAAALALRASGLAGRFDPDVVESLLRSAQQLDPAS